MRPSATRNGRRATSEYILYDANAGYQQTPLSVVTRPAKKPDSGHTDTISIAVLAGRSRWNAMKPRMQCRETPDPVRPRSGSGPRSLSRRPLSACAGPRSARVAPASPRLLRPTRWRPLRPLTRPGSPLLSRLLPRPNRRRARRNTRQRSGKTPQTAKKPGLGAGPGHPEPRRERRDISRPFSNDHAG